MTFGSSLFFFFYSFAHQMDWCTESQRICCRTRVMMASYYLIASAFDLYSAARRRDTVPLSQLHVGSRALLSVCRRKRFPVDALHVQFREKCRY